MSQSSRYSAYWESQNDEKVYSEIVENNRDIQMMGEAQDVFFDRYRAMNQRERKEVRGRVALKAFLSLAVPLLILIAGFWMDNAFIIVPAIFLTLGMLMISGYYLALYIKLHSLDAKISSAGVQQKRQISEDIDPIDRLKMDFERSEMREKLAESRKSDNREPFRRK